jgi:hypothetical protein
LFGQPSINRFFPLDRGGVSCYTQLFVLYLVQFGSVMAFAARILDPFAKSGVIHLFGDH